MAKAMLARCVAGWLRLPPAAVTDVALVAQSPHRVAGVLPTNDCATWPVSQLRSNRLWRWQNATGPADAKVLTGIDVLERDNFKQLAGMRVGLVTNQTGRDRDDVSTIDVSSKRRM